MKASLRSVRIAPKKANLVAAMIRGLTVTEAQSSLQRTNKKAARILEALLESAVANAKHNEKQSVDTLVVKSLVVNKAQAYHRGVPMARGRVRPMRKFLSHISLALGIADAAEEKSEKSQKSETSKKSTAKKEVDSASQKEKKPVKDTDKSEKGTPASAPKGSTAGTTTSDSDSAVSTKSTASSPSASSSASSK